MGNARNLAFWVVLFLMILALFNLFSDGATTMNSRQISYSDFIQRVDNDQIAAVTIDGEELAVTGTDGNQYATIRPQGEDIADRLIAAPLIRPTAPYDVRPVRVASHFRRLVMAH